MSQVLKDSMRAELDALAESNRDNTEVAAPVLYRLAAGYDYLWWGAQMDVTLAQELMANKDVWLSQLTAASDRGVLADDLRYWDLVFKFQIPRSDEPAQDDEPVSMAIAGTVATVVLRRG